ncbi:PREDICTED: retinol dehydrogenase 11-like [Ipomoea nil]|uniref:retinol dehydrogenase 11-like n=1 Tax=Ipomoea nil TaxID=35883 RepID=UPI000901FEF1|nr:PREDICTED: retinol dehydrogenase 11-like [Ipomoea nil]
MENRPITALLESAEVELPGEEREREKRMAPETKEKKEGSGSEDVRPKKKVALGWIEWLRGLLFVVYELLFQRIAASHLENPMPLPPVNDLTCIVTGSTSGIGREIARQLAEAGAHVVMAVRNTKAANELIKKWQEDWAGKGLPLNIEVMELDLVSLDSVVRFADAWNARAGPLHVLINNAGIFSIGEPQKFTKDGYEEHMQVNHLAPALLSILLLPSLIRGSPSRIINVNSIIHYVGFVDPEDMNVVSGKRKYASLVGYSGSKLAQVMYSSMLQKRLPAEAGINVICVSPGIVQTNVARDLPRFIQGAYRLIPYLIFNPEEGSRSTLFAATDPQVPEYCETLKADDWPVCAYLSQDCRPMNPSEESHNLETSYKVWEKTLELIGLPTDAVERLIEGEEVECKYGKPKE